MNLENSIQLVTILFYSTVPRTAVPYVLSITAGFAPNSYSEKYFDIQKGNIKNLKFLRWLKLASVNNRVIQF